jgi:hypothetical protein
VHGGDEGAFLVAGGADAALFAGVGDVELVAAVGAADAGEAFAEVAALEELPDFLYKPLYDTIIAYIFLKFFSKTVEFILIL